MSTTAPETAEQVPTAPNTQETTTDAAAAPVDAAAVPEAVAPGPEPKAITRKDMSLREFLTKMDDYAPIVCLETNL